MAMDQAQALVEKMMNDGGFNKQVTDYLSSHDKEATRLYLQELGYNVTEAEVKAAASEIIGEELNEEDLERIAGGGDLQWVATGVVVGAIAAVAAGAAAA